MSEGTAVAIIVSIMTALPPTIAAVAAYRQAKLNAQKTDENTALTKATSDKTDAIVQKTAEIGVTTDGHLSKVTAELSAANTRIAEMATAQAGLRELVDALIKRETTNGQDLHTIVESLTEKKD